MNGSPEFKQAIAELDYKHSYLRCIDHKFYQVDVYENENCIEERYKDFVNDI